MTGVAAISELPPQSNFKLGMLNELRIYEPQNLYSNSEY